jgi:methionyl-tRNA synthetase
MDGYYSEDMLITRINAELANDLGNLVSRTAAMAERYFDGIVPAPVEPDDLDEDLKKTALEAVLECERQLDRIDYSAALGAIWRLVNRANKYIDETAPWVLAREKASQGRLATVINNLVEAIRVIAIATAPFMPTLPARINGQFAFFNDPNQITWDEAKEWGRIVPGSRVHKTENLFPRVENGKRPGTAANKEEKHMDEPVVETAQEKEENETITIEEFARMDLRVAEVKAAEKMKKADKLLVLKLQVGDEERTVVSGIAQWYTPEELVGKKVVLVANLKPTKLRGVMSEGMILAAHEGDQLEVLTLSPDFPSGSRVR